MKKRKIVGLKKLTNARYNYSSTAYKYDVENDLEDDYNMEKIIFDNPRGRKKSNENNEENSGSIKYDRIDFSSPKRKIPESKESEEKTIKYAPLYGKSEKRQDKQKKI